MTQTPPTPATQQPGQPVKPPVGPSGAGALSRNNSPIPGVHFDAAQQAKFDALSNDVRSRIGAINADKQLSESEKHIRGQKVIKDADARLMSMLTPSQQRVFKEQQRKDAQENLHQQQSPPQRMPSGEGGAHVTPYQKARLEEIHSNSLKNALAVMQNPKYSKQDQEQILKAIYKSEQDQVMAILSPEPPKLSPPLVKMGPPVPSPPPSTAPTPSTGPGGNTPVQKK